MVSRVRMSPTEATKEKQRTLMAGRNAGTKNPNWKGGRRLRNEYVVLWVSPDSIYLPMANKEGNGRRAHFVAEHRLVMAEHLGRCLETWEIVHHKNGIKDDNRIENLELTTRAIHSKAHTSGYRDGFEQGYQEGYKRWLEDAMSKSTIDQA